MPGIEQRLKAKVGPAPVYVWVIVAVVGFYIFRKFSGSGGTSSSPVTSSPGVDTGTSSSGGVGSAAAPASGQGAAIDNLPSDLLSALAYNPAQINSNLTDSLNNSVNAISGLGSYALSLNGQIQQAIIDSYTPVAQSVQPVYYYSPTPGAPPMQTSPAPPAVTSPAPSQYVTPTTSMPSSYGAIPSAGHPVLA